LNTAEKNIRVQQWVAAVSLLLLLGKLAAFYITHSIAILTDALESIVNVVAGFFGLYSLYLSAKPKDQDHPYGHGKIEFISAATEGLMITIAGILIIIEAIRNLMTPVTLQRLDIGILLISITAVINYLLGTVCLRTGVRNNSSALIASGRHLHADVYSTLGILVGLFLLYLTKVVWIDSIVALLFSFIILYTGIKIIRTSVAGIMDESDRVLLDQMVTVLDSNRSKNWVDLHNLRIIKYGGTLHVDCHLTVPWYLNVHEAHEEIEKLGGIVRTGFEHSIELFVHSDGCLPISCPICIKDDCAVRHHPFKRRVVWKAENIQQDKKHQVDTL
jgi:cation diffusion facilitator family transporter